MWDPTTRDPRDGIHALWSGSTESQPLDCQGSPLGELFKIVITIAGKQCDAVGMLFNRSSWQEICIEVMIEGKVMSVFHLYICDRNKS